MQSRWRQNTIWSAPALFGLLAAFGNGIYPQRNIAALTNRISTRQPIKIDQAAYSAILHLLVKQRESSCRPRENPDMEKVASRVTVGQRSCGK